MVRVVVRVVKACFLLLLYCHADRMCRLVKCQEIPVVLASIFN